VSDQVIRYATEQEYIEYTNHRLAFSTGTEMKGFPDPKADPDEYWRQYYEQRGTNPNIIMETWTVLESEEIEKGALVRQNCHFVTMRYDDIEHARASRKQSLKQEREDPGVPVSAEFGKIQDAEKMRFLLMEGEPGYYYDIKHRTGVGG
jgi:hypothetical protein